MTTQAVRGFTIVEVVLFLAVTGLLTIGVLVGSSAAIAQQRYRDSVNSLKGFIQEQYSQTVNVMDGDVNNPACSVSGNSLILDSGTLQPRGTSDCLLLGRYLIALRGFLGYLSKRGFASLSPDKIDLPKISRKLRFTSYNLIIYLFINA